MKAEDIVYPIPISNGHVVTIHNLPGDLSRQDAEKIAALIKALAVKPELSDDLSIIIKELRNRCDLMVKASRGDVEHYTVKDVYYAPYCDLEPFV